MAYMEWADFLNDIKCGGPREYPERTPVVEIGYKYRWFEYDRDKGIITVTKDNIEWIKRNLYERANTFGACDCDIDEFERVDGEQIYIEED